MKNIYLIIAKQIVEEAGKIIREARETNSFTFEFKSDNSPISNIDQQVQDYMSKRLKDSFDIQVMGEENCDEIDSSKPYWAIDPIDGTWSFITYENTSVITR
jgi:3'-phosphoadenosine 5'-phosphosulfate (PAPS) 3'-phosphatase